MPIDKGTVSDRSAGKGTFTGFDGPEDVVRHQLVIGGNENVQTTNSADVENRSGQTGKNSEKERAKRALEQLTIQQAIEAANKAIAALIDQCNEMAKWYWAEAKKAGAAMEKIATRMGENSAFIEGVDTVFRKYQKEKTFDKDKAIELLRGRGLNVNKNTSDDVLRDLLTRQKTLLLENNRDLSNRHDEQQKRKEEFEKKAQENDQQARDLKREQDAIKENHALNDEEKQQQLEDVKSKYEPDAIYKAAKLTDDKEATNRDAEKLKETLKAPQVVDKAEAFLSILGRDKPDTGSMRGQFVNAVADIVSEKVEHPEVNPEKKISPAVNSPVTSRT